MPDIRIAIANRPYTVTCQPGEEAHLERLGVMLDAASRKAGPVGTLTETRSLLFAGLLLADELAEMIDKQAGEGAALASDAPPAKAQGDLLAQDNYDDLAARALERLAARLENLASTLEKGRVQA